MNKSKHFLWKVKWNQVFWGLFIIAAAIMVVGFFANVIYVDIMLGLIVVGMGLSMIAFEITSRKLRKDQYRISEALDFVAQWLENSHNYNKAMHRKSDIRFHNYDKKHADIETKIEDNYRSLARKIIEVENKLNMITKAEIRDVARQAVKEAKAVEKTVLVPIEKTVVVPITSNRLSKLSERQANSLKFIRQEGKVTTGTYRDRMGVSDKTAYNDLRSMVRKGLLKRGGTGSGTFYMMAF